MALPENWRAAIPHCKATHPKPQHHTPLLLQAPQQHALPAVCSTNVEADCDTVVSAFVFGQAGTKTLMLDMLASLVWPVAVTFTSK